MSEPTGPRRALAAMVLILGTGCAPESPEQAGPNGPASLSDAAGDAAGTGAAPLGANVTVGGGRAPASTFHFAVLGDNAGGTREGVYGRALRIVSRMQPDLVLSVGDLVSGYDEDGWLSDAGRIAAGREAFDAEVRRLEVPYYYVPGNNDMFTRALHDDWLQRYGPTYYGFVHQDVLFVVLNSDEVPGSWNGELGEEQLEWLRAVLADNASVSWTLIFLHRPLWLENAPAWRPVEAMLGDRPRTLFAGHWHSYFRGELGGHDYYLLATTGGASDLSGPAAGSFDHITWVAMGPGGPRVTNVHLPGLWDDNPVAGEDRSELTTRIRSEGMSVAHDFLASGDLERGRVPFGEPQMNALGREALFESRLEDAAVLLELLVAAYPDSWRGHEGLADVQLQLGDLQRARVHYERSRELFPANRYARARLEALDSR